MMYLGLDVGGTTMRLRVEDEARRRVYEGESRGGTLTGIGREALTERFDDALQAAFHAAAFQPGDAARVCLGASGVDSEALREAYASIWVSLGFRPDQLLVMNDGELLLRMFDRPGMVLIAGTGSIALGTDGKDRWDIRCGGWEHLLSDEGSGTDLGLKLLRAYVKAKDGMREAPCLVRLMEEAGIRSAQDAAGFAAAHILEKADLARFAPMAEKAAGQGDRVCEEIIEEAADSLAALVHTVRMQLSGPEDIPLMLWGSVLLKGRMLPQALAARLPHCRLLLPGFSALDAAMCLARGEGIQAMEEKMTTL